MTHTSTTPLLQLVSLRSLRISTNLRLHPEFLLAPRPFARRRGVELADDVHPETDIRKDPDDPDSDERVEKLRSNIHLVRHGAIRLFTEREEDDDWVKSIDLNPAMLLYEKERHLLSKGDLTLSLDILRAKVSPLLAEPLDARLVVPVLLQDEEPVSYWSMVDSELYIPGIDIRCLHGLSHPSTGPAEGATEKRIQLGDKKDDCVIRFKKAKWEIIGPKGAETVLGVRVRLILKGRDLTEEFMSFGTTATVGNTPRLVAFPESSVAGVHQAMMARLDGTYLPVPLEWRIRPEGEKALTHAKAMALVACLTSIPLDELRGMDEEVRHPSDSTRKRLNKDLPVEANRLKPVAVSTLFAPTAYASLTPGMSAPAEDIDPTITDASSKT